MDNPAYIYRYSVRTIEYHTEEIELSRQEAAQHFTDPAHPTVEEMETVRATRTEEPHEYWHQLSDTEMMDEPGPELLKQLD